MKARRGALIVGQRHDADLDLRPEDLAQLADALSVGAVAFGDGAGLGVEPDEVAAFQQALAGDRAQRRYALRPVVSRDLGRLRRPVGVAHAAKDHAAPGHQAGIPDVDRRDAEPGTAGEDLDLGAAFGHGHGEPLVFLGSRTVVRPAEKFLVLPHGIQPRLAAVGGLGGRDHHPPEGAIFVKRRIGVRQRAGQGSRGLG